MATHIEAVIVNALFAAANAITFPVGFDKVWEAVKYDPSGNEVGYARFTVLKNDPDNPRIGFESEPIRRGIFQASVFMPSNKGLVLPTEQAGIIRDAFARGTKITSGDVVIRVDDEPTVGPALQEEAWLQVPVSIPYIVYP